MLAETKSHGQMVETLSASSLRHQLQIHGQYNLVFILLDRKLRLLRRVDKQEVQNSTIPNDGQVPKSSQCVHHHMPVLYASGTLYREEKWQRQRSSKRNIAFGINNILAVFENPYKWAHISKFW